MLVLSPHNEPTLLVPILERPDAEAAEGASSVSLVDWPDGTDPYEIASPLLRPDGEFGISDSACAMHLLGLQRALPRSSYRSLTESLPMMRAVKDDNELMRLAAAGAAADSTYGEIVQRRFAGFSLIYVRRSAKASREQTKQQNQVAKDATQPMLWVDICGDDGQGQALVLLFGNSGTSIAREVKVVFDPAPPSTLDINPILEILKKGIASLPPGRTMQWALVHLTMRSTGRPTRPTGYGSRRKDLSAPSSRSST